MQGLKENELTPCIGCGKKDIASSLVFYRVKIQNHAIDIKSVQQQIGLGAFLGSGELASVMGTNEDMTKCFSEHEGNVCQECAMRPLLMLLESKSGIASELETDT